MQFREILQNDEFFWYDLGLIFFGFSFGAIGANEFDDIYQHWKNGFAVQQKWVSSPGEDFVIESRNPGISEQKVRKTI
jgi:hypothetical protein